MTKPTDLLSKEEIRELTRASDLAGWRSVLTDWGLVAAAMALVAVWPNVLTVLVALVILGGRQLGLAILTHECAHYSLFATRWLNDVVGVWLAGSP
ncbi:MAG: fatty acid desaturase, partial [Myxococcota bacterium]